MSTIDPLLPLLIVVCIIAAAAGGLAVMVYGLAMLFDALTNERRRMHARGPLDGQRKVSNLPKR